MSSGTPPTVLVLTPVKDAVDCLDGYFSALERLAHPAQRLSLGFLESDSVDGTYDALQRRLPTLRDRYRRVSLTKHDYGFRIPDHLPRWTPGLQIQRRTVLAKCRNRLLSHALEDEEWVLWLDVDVERYPPDVLTRLLAPDVDVVTPHCVQEPGGPTFDLNAWRDGGATFMSDLRGGPDLVRLDAVGGTMLLVRADLHREGLVFPTFLYGRRNPAYLDYLDPSVATLVPARAVPAIVEGPPDLRALFAGAQWWRPDEEAAAMAVRAAIEGRDQPAAEARELMLRDYSMANAAEGLAGLIATARGPAGVHSASATAAETASIE